MLTHAEVEASTKDGRRDPDTHNACKVVARGLLGVAYCGFLHGVMMILGPNTSFNLFTAIVVSGPLDKDHSLCQTRVDRLCDCCIGLASYERACWPHATAYFAGPRRHGGDNSQANMAQWLEAHKDVDGLPSHSNNRGGARGCSCGCVCLRGCELLPRRNRRGPGRLRCLRQHP